jgi:hypothetical protein
MANEQRPGHMMWLVGILCLLVSGAVQIGDEVDLDAEVEPSNAAGPAVASTAQSLLRGAQLLQSYWAAAPVSSASSALFAMKKLSNVGTKLDLAIDGQVNSEEATDMLDQLTMDPEQCNDVDGSSERIDKLKQDLISSLNGSERGSLKKMTNGISSILGVYKAFGKLSRTCSVSGAFRSGVAAVHNVWNGVNDLWQSEESVEEEMKSHMARRLIGAKKQNLDCVMKKAVCPAVSQALYDRTVLRMGKRNGAKSIRYQNAKFTVVDDQTVLFLLDFLNDPELPEACGALLHVHHFYEPEENNWWPTGESLKPKKVCASHGDEKAIEQTGKCRDGSEPRDILLASGPSTRELIRSGLYPDWADTGESRIGKYLKRSGLPIDRALKIFNNVYSVRSEWWNINNVLWLVTVPSLLGPAGAGVMSVSGLGAVASAVDSLVWMAQSVQFAEAEQNECRRQATMLENAEAKDPKPLSEMSHVTGVVSPDAEDHVDAAKKAQAAQEAEEVKKANAKEGLVERAMNELEEQLKYLDGNSVNLQARKALEPTWDELLEKVGGASKKLLDTAIDLQAQNM